jgi:AcrR family transcriptional regulator
MPLGSEPPTFGKGARHERARDAILAACWEVAREKGLAGFSLRDVATAVGIQPPSLYSYFPSKNAIYDAMFAAGNRELLARMEQVRPVGSVEEQLRAAGEAFVGFCVEDPTRHQLLFQRTVPGFEPSAEAYAVAERAYAVMRTAFASLGITDEAHLDIWTALLSGLAAQQLANQPAGDRWTVLVADAVSMFTAFVAAGKSEEKP